MPLIDNAIYREGRRVRSPRSLDETYELAEAEGGMAWIGLYRPTDDELASVGAEFALHHLAVEDAGKGHQRAKLERYGDTLFVALRPARYLDPDERVARRIYDLSREVISFQRAVHPLVEILEALLHEREGTEADVELQRSLRDVLDHVRRVVDRADGYRALLDNALQVQSTLVTRAMTRTSIQQNEQMKRITSWAAILFAPSLVGAVYGMNFTVMPELEWPLGYPFALGLMLALGGSLYLVFKRKRWL